MKNHEIRPTSFVPFHEEIFHQHEKGRGSSRGHSRGRRRNYNHGGRLAPNNNLQHRQCKKKDEKREVAQRCVMQLQEVEEYFTNYIVNDSLGIIAHAHVVFADREPDMAMSNPCKELAQLYSIAVDFPKTGVPAEIPSKLRPKEYPDFMDKADKKTYISERVIGKLYRKVKDKAPQASSIATFTREVARRSYDTDMEVDGFEDYIDEAFDYKSEYDNKLGNLMDYYGIKTEAEILSGRIMKVSKTFDRRKDAEAICVAVRALRKEARTWFKRLNDIDDMLPKASAWYHVTYHPRYWGCYSQGLKRDHFISFPWCVYDQLIQIKKEKARNRPVLNMSSLRSQLSRKLVLK